MIREQHLVLRSLHRHRRHSPAAAAAAAVANNRMMLDANYRCVWQSSTEILWA